MVSPTNVINETPEDIALSHPAIPILEYDIKKAYGDFRYSGYGERFPACWSSAQSPFHE
jgi:hypothetical protein